MLHWYDITFLVTMHDNLAVDPCLENQQLFQIAFLFVFSK